MLSKDFSVYSNCIFFLSNPFTEKCKPRGKHRTVTTENDLSLSPSSVSRSCIEFYKSYFFLFLISISVSKVNGCHISVKLFTWNYKYICIYLSIMYFLNLYQYHPRNLPLMSILNLCHHCKKYVFLYLKETSCT